MRGFSSSIRNRYQPCKKRKIDQEGYGQHKNTVNLKKSKKKCLKPKKLTKESKHRL